MENIETTIEELHNKVMDMDPSNPELPELKRSLAVCKEISHAAHEGLIEMETIEDDEGNEEFRFYPASMDEPLIEA